MNKRLDFDEIKESRMDEKIDKTLNAEFEVPKLVEMAKQEAFMQIRRKAAQSKTDSAESVQEKTVSASSKRRKKFRTMYKVMAGTVAAAAVFSGICITNPAFAANVPVVGSVFEKIGKSLGYSGDYSKYAEPLGDGEQQAADVEENTGVETSENISQGDNQEPSAGDTVYSKTVDGVTVTLSEVYCNDAAMYLSLLVESEEPLPDTLQYNQEGKPILIADADMKLDFNPGYNLANAYLDGDMLDENTYAGVLRIEMRDATFNYEGYNKFFEARNAFLKEKGFNMETIDYSETSPEEIAEALGMESLADENFKAIGGPDIAEYNEPIEIPEKFHVDFNIHNIVGRLPENQRTKPEMPQEFKDEYNQAMAENGLDESNYENFTEEEKEIEHRLYTEMWNKYTERYPEVIEMYNSYEYWMLKGDWDFSFDVEVNNKDTVTKEVNFLDEAGYGVTSVTKTPFEVSVQLYDPEGKYCEVALDADGDMLPYGGTGYADTYAVQDRNVSKIYIYLCDYYQYMDELKGYSLAPNYEEKKKTKNFKQYLDEKGVPFTEVVFEQE